MKTLITTISFLLISTAAFAQVGEPIDGLTDAELALFDEGKALFEKEFTALEGVGPLYNRVSCVECHGGPVTGGADPNGVDGNANHFFIRTDSSTWIPGHEFGGPVAQERTTAGDPGVEDCTLAPENPGVVAFIPNAHVSTRHTPPIFGFGLIDAVPDRRIVRWAGKKRWKRSGAVGVPNWGREMQGLTTAQTITIDPIPRTTPTGPARVGRFGWKSQTATLFQFSAEPFNVELGVTSPFFPRENEPTIINPFNPVPVIPPECDPIPGADDADGTQSASLYYFQAFTAPPQRANVGAREFVGELVAGAVGCLDCHRRRLRTGDYYIPWTDGSAHKVDALSRRTFYPYSDLLVHDMGEANDDLRQMGGASGRFWRTTPLWGLRHKTNYWHDGASTTVEHAIYRHEGEGAASRDAWDGLSPFLKGLVSDFLDSL